MPWWELRHTRIYPATNIINFIFYRPQLTSTDVDKRCHGVHFLSDVLHRLVGFPFQEKEGCIAMKFSIYPILIHILFLLTRSIHCQAYRWWEYNLIKKKMTGRWAVKSRWSHMCWLMTYLSFSLSQGEHGAKPWVYTQNTHMIKIIYVVV